MNAKPTPPDEFRISASEFDKIMRGALSAALAEKETKKSGSKKNGRKGKSACPPKVKS